MLDAVEKVIGPNILIQSADIFVKPAHGRKHINWHQDANYWGLDPYELVTGWIALTDVNLDNGCFEKGASINSCEKIIDKLGDSILLITDADLTKIGLNNNIINVLSKSSSLKVFDDVESDPSKKTLVKALDMAKTFKPTGILGFGGGSSMDIAKLVSLRYNQS